MWTQPTCRKNVNKVTDLNRQQDQQKQLPSMAPAKRTSILEGMMKIYMVLESNPVRHKLSDFPANETFKGRITVMILVLVINIGYREWGFIRAKGMKIYHNIHANPHSSLHWHINNKMKESAQKKTKMHSIYTPYNHIHTTKIKICIHKTLNDTYLNWGEGMYKRKVKLTKRQMMMKKIF